MLVAGQTPALRLTLLGGFSCRTSAGSALVFPTRKAGALLCFLAVAEGLPRTREQLAALFWADQTDRSARANLRSTLCRLRQSLPAELRPAIAAGPEGIAVSAGSCDSDLAEFRERVREQTPEALQRALELYRGRFLDGLHDCAQGFEDWVESERRRLQEAYQGVLCRLLDHYVVTGAIERGIQTALRLLELDPLDEATHRSLIRLYLYQDRLGAALNQYDQCRMLLSRELGVPPEPETERLRAELLRRSPPTAAGAGAQPEIEMDTLPERPLVFSNATQLRIRQRGIATGRPILAVLAFDSDGTQAVPRHLAEGLAEDIAIELGRFRELDVIAPASAFAYRSARVPPDRVGRELGTDYVLCGTLRARPGAFRIGIQLINAASAAQIWAESYDCAADDIFDAQDETVQRIAAELGGRVAAARLGAIRRKRPINEARLLFDQAIAIDPEFARPYVGKALALLNEWACYSWNHWFFLKGHALEMARTAVRLDERDNRAHCMLGLTQIYSGDYLAAEKCLVRALELNPNDCDVLAHAACGLALIGDHERACDAGRRALRLAPYHPEWYVVMIGTAFFSGRRYDEAVEVISTAPEANCSIPAVLAAAYALRGEPERGLRYRDTVHRHFSRMIDRGAVPRGKSCIDWLLELDPFQKRTDADHYRAGLQRAGFE